MINGEVERQIYKKLVPAITKIFTYSYYNRTGGMENPMDTGINFLSKEVKNQIKEIIAQEIIAFLDREEIKKLI